MTSAAGGGVGGATNQRNERRAIVAASLVASLVLFALVLMHLGGGTHDVESHSDHHRQHNQPSAATVTPKARGKRAGRPPQTTAASTDDSADGSDDTPTAPPTRAPKRKGVRLSTAAAPLSVPHANEDELVGDATDGRATFVVMSYPGSDRHHRLIEILRRVLMSEYELAYRDTVHEGLLVWNGNDPSKIPPKVKATLEEINGGNPGTVTTIDDPESVATHVIDYGAKLRVLVMRANSVDNRWRLGAFLRTPFAISVDDDVNLSPEGAACLVNVRHAVRGSHVLVGAAVRSHCVHPDKTCKDHVYAPDGRIVEGPPAGHGPFGYAARHIVQPGNKKHYSIVLPRAIVVTRQTMLAYDRAWRDASTGVRAVVRDLRCDDIALNFVAANASRADATMLRQRRGATAVYVKARFQDFPESHSEKGMTKERGMKEKRQRCVNRLAAIFSPRGNADGDDDAGANAALQSGVGVPEHRPWFVHCSVDG